MKKVINLCLMLLPLNVIAQNTDAIIRNIRSEYATIVANKDKYEKVIINVPPQDLFPFDDEGDQPYIERIVTYHLEGDEIKLISVSSEYTFRDTELEQVEYYLKNNEVFFMYQQYKREEYPDDYQWETRTTEIEERRIYYDSNQPVKCLIKKVEGTLLEIDSLLQNTTNKEEDCSQMWNIGGSLIYVFHEENIDVLFECYQKHEKK